MKESLTLSSEELDNGNAMKYLSLIFDEEGMYKVQQIGRFQLGKHWFFGPVVLFSHIERYGEDGDDTVTPINVEQADFDNIAAIVNRRFGYTN